MDFQTKIVQNNAFDKYHRRLITFKHQRSFGFSFWKCFCKDLNFWLWCSWLLQIHFKMHCIFSALTKYSGVLNKRPVIAQIYLNSQINSAFLLATIFSMSVLISYKRPVQPRFGPDPRASLTTLRPDYEIEWCKVLKSGFNYNCSLGNVEYFSTER